MKKIVLIVYFVVAFFASFADEPETDADNIYSNAFSSLITIISETSTEPVGTIVLSYEDFILAKIPDSYNGVHVEKSWKFKPLSKYDGAIWIRIDNISLDLDKLYVFAKIERQTNGEFENWKQGIASYKITYQCDFKNNTFELIDYSEGNAVQP